jgi:2-dehydropantoate 2-reductase
MRYIIYGAGGIGSVIGGFLHLSDCEVILKARPAHVSAIQTDGLKLISSRGRWTLPIPAVSEIEDLCPFSDEDVVLLTAKSQHTLSCLGELRNAGAPVDLPVFCMQNGIWNEPTASRIFHRIYGAMIVVPGFFIHPGEVIHWFTGDAGYIDVGCYPRGSDDLVRKVVEDLKKAGFVAKTDDRVMRSKTGKCLGILRNAMAAIACNEEQENEYLHLVRTEATKVWTACGLEWESREAFNKRIRSEGQWETWVAPELAGKDWGGSGWQTLARKAGSSETPHLNGDVVRLGRDVGVPTPANEALCVLSVRAALETQAPGSIPFDELWKLYQKFADGSEQDSRLASDPF